MSVLLDEAAKHLKLVDHGTVIGERKYVIKDGKAMVEVPDNVHQLWEKCIKEAGLIS